MAKYEAQIPKLFGCTNLSANMWSRKPKPLYKESVLFIIIGVWISIFKIDFSTVQASGLQAPKPHKKITVGFLFT